MVENPQEPDDQSRFLTGEIQKMEQALHESPEAYREALKRFDEEEKFNAAMRLTLAYIYPSLASMDTMDTKKPWAGVFFAWSPEEINAEIARFQRGEPTPTNPPKKLTQETGTEEQRKAA